MSDMTAIHPATAAITASDEGNSRLRLTVALGVAGMVSIAALYVIAAVMMSNAIAHHHGADLSQIWADLKVLGGDIRGLIR